MYFGTTTPPPYVATVGFDVNNYNPGPLEYNTTYYWQIIEVNDPCIWEGDIWSFKTIPPGENKLLNAGFEQPPYDGDWPTPGSPVADWTYQGDPDRYVGNWINTYKEGSQSAASLIAYYSHDEPDGHLYQEVNVSASAWRTINLSGYVNRYVLDGDYNNHPDWGWVTVAMKVDDEISPIWQQDWNGLGNWQYFEIVTDPVFVNQNIGVHIYWGTQPSVGTKTFDVMALDAFFLDEHIVSQPCDPLEPYWQVCLSNCWFDHDSGYEAHYTVPPGYVITGLGFRAFGHDVTTIRVRMCELLSDGTMGLPQEVRAGSDPYADLEVNINLPPCYVMVGFGARSIAVGDITTLAVWARPIQSDGTLGPVEEFRAGSDPYHSLEKQFLIPQQNRAMTGAGMKCDEYDITGLYVESCEMQTLLVGDIDRDDDVDLSDLDIFHLHWLDTDCGQWANDETDWCYGTDINHDGSVDFYDFARLALNWLITVE